MKLCIAILLIVLATPSGRSLDQDAKFYAHDISSSGNQFLTMCSGFDKPQQQWNEIESLNNSSCMGFMWGVQSGISLAFANMKRTGSMMDVGVCMPESVTVEQAIRVVLKYIRNNPEKAHQPSAEMVVSAEKNAFPCSQK